MNRRRANLAAIRLSWLLLWALGPLCSAAPPPSPASLNIKTLYEGLYLPESHFPSGYRCETDLRAAYSLSPPRRPGYSQSFLAEVPFPSLGGKISKESNVDDWKHISISDARLYPTARNAHDVMAYYAYGSSYTRPSPLGDEAVFRPWEETRWRTAAGTPMTRTTPGTEGKPKVWSVSGDCCSASASIPT